MGGLGGALVYLPPLATAPKWWPDRKTLATGCSVVGMGLGSFIMGPLATWMISVFGWREVFWYCGAAMGLLAVLASLPLTVPPPGWKPSGWTRPPRPPGVPKTPRDYTHAEAIKTPQFRLLNLSYFCGSCAGLMVISQIAGHGRDAGLSAMAAGWAVSCLAFTNAATRILTGIFVDRIGVKTIFIAWFSLQVIALVLLFPAGRTWWALCLVAALIGWNYGGMFTLFPSSCLVYFGPTAQGANYRLMSSAWGLAGLIGPFVGGYLKDATGSYLAPFIGGAAAMAISVIMSTRLKPLPKASPELPKVTPASFCQQLSPAGRLAWKVPTGKQPLLWKR